MTVFLVSLGMLFSATVIGYLTIRFRARVWPPPGMPHLPLGLAVSTIVIIVASITGQRALRAAREDRAAAVRRGLAVTLGLGVLFLVCQVVNWAQLLPAVRTMGVRALSGPAGRVAAPIAHDPTPRQFAFLFYTLTGLHALHVLGGLVALSLTARRAWAGWDWSAQLRRVRHTVVYWHFLAAVWLVLYAALLI